MNPGQATPIRPGAWGLVGALVSCALTQAAAPVAAEPAGEKTFVLFMGADIDVEQGKAAHRVKNVAGDAFVITVDSRPVEVPMNRGLISMRVTPQLKLSDKTAVVNDLKIERAYTPQNDPNRKWAAAQSGGAAQAQLGNSATQMGNAMLGVQNANIRAATLANGQTTLPVGDASAQINRYNQSVGEAGSDQNSSGYAAGRLQEELDKKLFDAMQVNCVVSAPRPLTDPYLVVIAHYREKDDPPGTAKSWVFAKSLDRLDEQPLTVRILQGGFPPGFELLKQQIHVYGGGRELGTNVAAKNVALTREEAHEYIVIDYLTANKGATTTPSVALGVSYKEFFPHFASVQLQQEIWVKVDKSGRTQGAFRDERCSQATGDDYLDALVARTRFKPALQAGKAVDGMARLKIASLAL